MAGRILLLALLGATTLPGAASAQDAAPDYSRYRDGLFLRYLDADGDGLNEVPHIGLSFGGRELRAVIDSGSTGVVVAASSIPDFEQLETVGAGRLTYTSSGRVMVGQWVVTPLSLHGQEGARIGTEPMPVLAVTEVDCLEDARDCRPSDDPRGIAMVGVGFGREGDDQSQSTPDKNPLLRVLGVERRGYVLTSEGVQVGLTAAGTRGDFRFVKLDRQKDRPDWAETPACISLNGEQPPACGSMLVDTGVSVMFMTVPESQAAGAGRALPDGAEVSISVGTPEGAFELYGFTVGGGSPLAPSATHLRVSPDRTFVNTSFHLLNGFDVLFDADGGYAGFRRR